MTLATYPHEFARRAAVVLGGDLEASITVRQHGLTLRAGSSTDAAGRCDQAEARAEEGPCIDAMEHGSVCMVETIADGTGWDRWRRQVLREGFATAIAVPALVEAHVAVALNLYSRAADPWKPELLTAADGYAQLLASAVRLQLEVARLEDTATGFYRDMADTMVAERAVGAIMHTNGCTQDEAYHILETASRHRNVARRDVAETILRALVPPGESAH